MFKLMTWRLCFQFLLVDMTSQKDEDFSVFTVAAANQKENSFILPQNTGEYKPRERLGV